MNNRIIEIILSLRNSGLSVVPNPSKDHPDNDLYHKMSKMGIIIFKDTVERGIIAIGLTSLGKKIQNALEANKS